MKNTSRFVVVACFALVAATLCSAQNLTIDNFSTGPYKKQLASGTNQTSQAGTMLGGSRLTDFLVCDPVPCHTVFKQTASFQILPNKKGTSALIQSAGYKTFPRLVVEYGVATPLHLNLSGSYDRLRVNFDGIDQVLNFNILAFSDGGYNQTACNLLPSTNPVSVDFPLIDFANSGGDFTDVTRLLFEFQSGSAIGGNDWAVTSFEALPASAPPADVVCHGFGS